MGRTIVASPSIKGEFRGSSRHRQQNMLRTGELKAPGKKFSNKPGKKKKRKTANSTKAKTLGYESNCEVWAEKIQKTKPARTQGMAVPEDLRKNLDEVVKKTWKSGNE